MKIQIELDVLDEYHDKDFDEFAKIFELLINKGALTGIKGGKAMLHFDGDGIFRGLELDYWPWKKR